MYQQEFNEIYDRLSRFAFSKAGRYWRDYAQRQDAVDEAMYKFVYQLSVNNDIKDIETWGRTVILNALKDSSKKKRDLEPITITDTELPREDQEGTHGYEITKGANGQAPNSNR